MSLTFLNQPKRWQSAQLPVLYEFDYKVVLPPLNTGNPDYIGSYLQFNNAGKLRILAVIGNSNVPIVGGAFYVGSGSELKYPEPVTVTANGQVALGNGDVYLYYDTDTDYRGGDYIDLYTLEFVEKFNPGFRLYVDNADAGPIRYDRDISGRFRFNLSPYLRKYFRNMGFPGMSLGIEAALFRKYRVDYTINGVTTTGEDRYAINSMVQPANPACANNLPDWQFDLSTLQCEQNNPRTNSNRVARQKDVNPNSPTFNQFRNSGALFYYDSNATSCPVTYASEARSQQFRRNNCAAGSIGSFVTYTIPAGAHTSTISQADANAKADAALAAGGQAYANANGVCSVISPSFDFRNVSTEFAGIVQGTYADIYILVPTGGPVTLYYDIVNKINGVVQSSSVHSAMITGTDFLVSAYTRLVRNDPGANQLEETIYTNLRLNP